MIDAYRIGVRLEMDNRGISNQLRSLSKNFADLQKLGVELGKSGKDTAQAIGKISTASKAAASNMRAMADAMRAVTAETRRAAGAAQGAERANEASSARRQSASTRSARQRYNDEYKLATYTNGNLDLVSRKQRTQATERSRSDARRYVDARKLADFENRNIDLASANISRKAAAEARAASQQEQAMNRAARQQQSMAGRRYDDELRMANLQNRNIDIISNRRAAAARTAARAEATAERQAARESQQAWSRARRTGMGMGGGLGAVGGFAGVATVALTTAQKSAEYDRDLMSVQLIRGRTSDRDNVDKASHELAANHGNMGLHDASHMIRELVPTIGLDSAIQFKELFADARTSLIQAYGGHLPENAMADLVRFLEQINHVNGADGNPDREKMAAGINIAIGAVLDTAGQAPISGLTAAARYMGPMARSLSDEAMRKRLGESVLNNGGMGSGTQMDAMMAPMLAAMPNADGKDTGKRLTYAQVDEYRSAGYLDMSKVAPDRHHDGHYRLLPGAIPKLAEIQEDPYAFKLKTIRAYAKTHGISEEESIYRMFPTIRARRGGTQILDQDLQGLRLNEYQHEQRLGGAGMPNARRDSLGNLMHDKNGQVIIDEEKVSRQRAALIETGQTNELLSFQKALENLSVVLGTALFKDGQGILHDFTSKLNEFSAWAEKNPEQVKEGLKIILGVGGLMAVGGAITLFAAALVPFAIAGSAYLALNSLSNEGIPGFIKALETLQKVIKDMLPDGTPGLGTMAMNFLTAPVRGVRALTNGAIDAGVALNNRYNQSAAVLSYSPAQRDAYIAAEAARLGVSPASVLNDFNKLPPNEQASKVTGVPLPMPSVASMAPSQVGAIPPGLTPTPGSAGSGTMPTDEEFRRMGVPMGPVTGGPGARHSSFVPNASTGTTVMQPVHVVLNGEVMGRATLKYAAKVASGPSRGYSGFDGRQGPLVPGALTA